MEPVTVTIGLPLPNVDEHQVDVSWKTRDSINKMTRYSASKGITIVENAVRSVSVPHNHNHLANNFTGDWLLVIGSDHTFSENALELLLNAANEEPYPKIIAGITPFRGAPYRYVVNKFDKYRESVQPIVPYIDFHPAMTLSTSDSPLGEIMEVDAIGSGFCLYHRSVFDTLSYPWFRYAPRKASDRDMTRILREFSDHRTLPELLEGLANGHRFIRDEEKELLKKKADDLRWLLGKMRCPIPFGPDYTICLDAQSYDIKSYVHFGCTVWHLTYAEISVAHYVNYAREPHNWWNEVINGRVETVDDVQEIRQWAQKAGLKKMLNMNPDELEKDYAEKTGTGVETASESGTPELERET